MFKIFKSKRDEDKPIYSITGRGTIKVKYSDMLKTEQAKKTLATIKEIELDNEK